MEEYQQESTIGSISQGDHNDTFSFSFSFKTMVLQDDAKDQDLDSDFEFICNTPDSPSSDSDNSSPADHLFFNGRLQPHTFPFQPFKDYGINFSRCTSLTSSNGSTSSSKDSFASSRSNSSNSGSSCSSARTSSSEYRDKKPMYSHSIDPKTTFKRQESLRAKPAGTLQPYASAQRWQFITPAPILMSTPELPRRKGNEATPRQDSKPKQVVKTSRRSWFCLRIFRFIISACRTCHALDPEKIDGPQRDIEFGVI